MPENGRLVELVAKMLEEIRQMKEEQRETNKKLEKLEKQQAETNVILRQHTRDLMKIADLLDKRVVHWGDRVRISGKQGVSGNIAKVR